MAMIEVNGIHMYYELHGQGEPLVCISGLAADHVVWTSILDQLTKKFRVLIFDNRGVGQSDSPDNPWTLEQMAEDTMALAAKLGLKKPHIVGNSMGGMIAQVIARRYSDQVKSVTLYSSGTHLPSEFAEISQMRLKLFQQQAPRKQIVLMTLAWAFSSEFLAKDDHLKTILDLGCQNPHPQTEVGFRRQLEAILKFDSRSWLKEISIPISIIAAEQDVIIPKKQAEELARLIPSAHFACLNAGHVSHIEQPQAFIQLLEEGIEICLKELIHENRRD